MQDQHQVVVHHQHEFIEAVVKALHMTKEDEKWLDPSYSPVMYDVWHMIYVYFIVVEKGELRPLTDTILYGGGDDFSQKHRSPGPMFPNRERFGPKN
jgi:hypothetical protein